VLELSHTDLGKNPVGLPGVHVWWKKTPGRKTPSLIVSWPDLVLVNPKLSWPEDMHPKRREGWGEETFRLSWVRELAQLSVGVGVPVPDLDPVLELERGDLAKAQVKGKILKITESKRFSRVESVLGSAVYLGRRTLKRMSSAIEQPERKLDLRLVSPEWAPGSLLVLAYRNGLRAVASAISEEAVNK